jgi:hypothetical protein
VPLTFDFGYVTPGSTHRGQIKIENPVSRRWPIEKVTTTCNCLQPIGVPEAIPADGDTKLNFRFDAFDEPTRYEKPLTIHTGDPNRPTLRVTVQASIGLPLAVEPGKLVVSPDERTTGSITVRNAGASPVELIYATSNAPGCYAEMPKTALPGNDRARLKVHVPDAMRRKSAHLKIHADHENQPILSVQVRTRDADIK